MKKIREADWQVFRRHHARLATDAKQKILDSLQAAIANSNNDVETKYAEVYRRLEEGDRLLQEGFDDYRRSTASLQVLKWYQAGWLDERMLAEYSSDLRDWVVQVGNYLFAGDDKG